MMGYYAGWDGGGTGTTAEYIAADGSTLARCKAGPLNPNGNSQAQVISSVNHLLTHMSSLPGGLNACRALCLATAGISNKNIVGFLSALLLKNHFKGQIIWAGDQESALYGALSGRAGAILISGTGSICYGKSLDGKTLRCGGWGNLADDEGSGYSIGRDVLSAVFKAEDGRAGKTLLSEMVFEELGIQNVQQLVEYLYAPGGGKNKIAAFAPLCTRACLMGDIAALNICNAAAGQLHLLAKTVVLKLGMPTVPLALAGSVLEKDEKLRHTFMHMISSLSVEVDVCFAEADAARGAALMAKKGAE